MLRLRSSFGALANVAHTHCTLIAIVLAALLLRVALLPLYARLPNGYLDEGFWKFWMQTIHEHGVLNIFRATDPDYVGYQWVLWLLSLVVVVSLAAWFVHVRPNSFPELWLNVIAILAATVLGIPAKFVKDGLHLSAEGYELWTAKLTPLIKPKK